MSRESIRVALAIVSLLSCVSCASAPKLPVFGTWRIMSYASPGVSAAAPVQTLAWVGASASFSAVDARFAGQHCSSPTYTPATLSAADFQQQYKVAPSSAGISGDQVTVFKLDCGYDWHGPTNALIVKSPTSLLTPWNGAFFELVKTEPAMK
ncbi:MAG TPA: hypothetical protein VM032_17250 [Vicinamibacterales bacterium]|nr:hypothetical protein [Vicinamibacterales bacterium]